MSERVQRNWCVLFAVNGDEDKVKERLVYKFRQSELKVVVSKRRLRDGPLPGING